MVFDHHSTGLSHAQWMSVHLQLEEGQISIAVISLTFALLRNVFLETGDNSRIIPLQALQNIVDMLRSIRGIVKSHTHLEIPLERWSDLHKSNVKDLFKSA